MSRTNTRIRMMKILLIPLGLAACVNADGGDEPDEAIETQPLGRGRAGFATNSGPPEGGASGVGGGGVAGGSVPMVNGGASAMMNGGASAMMNGGASAMMNGGAPAVPGTGGSTPTGEIPLVAKVIKTQLLIADIIYTKQIKLGVARIGEIRESQQENRYEPTNGAPDIEQPTVRAGVVYAEDIEANEVQANQLFAQKIQYF